MTGGGAARVGRSDVRGLFALALSLFACATPVAPEGGPVDATPPRLVATSPEADAVGVAERTVRLTFSERIDARSAAQAVTVTPLAGPGEPQPTVEAAADELVVTLPALRDSTTYVVTVGTQLADRRGVRLPAPLTLAFATGPTLDRGRITGAVRQPTDGAGVAGLTVLAYRVLGDSLPDPRTARPDARTETGADGAFELGYLADVPHFVAALRDLNRNGRADDGEPFAAPPAPRLRPALPAAPSAMPDSLGAPRTPVASPPEPLDLWLARRDTVPPRVVSVRALSNRRFRVRYSEGLRHPPHDAQYGVAQVFDAAVERQLAQGRVYRDADSDREVELWMDAPSAPGPARLRAAVRDSAGNYAEDVSIEFVVPDQPDTLRTRFVRFEPAPVAPDSAAQVPALLTDQTPTPTPIVVLSGPSDTPIEVRTFAADRPDTPNVEPVSATVHWPSASIRGPGDGVIPAFPARIEVVGPDTVYSATFAVGASLPPESTGEIVVPVPPGLPPTARLRAVVTLPGGATVSGESGAGDPVRFALAPGRYPVRVFVDDGSPYGDPVLAQTRNARWDGGALAPYAPPEKIVVLEPVEVRARWETEIDAALLAPLFDDAADAPSDR